MWHSHKPAINLGQYLNSTPCLSLSQPPTTPTPSWPPPPTHAPFAHHPPTTVRDSRNKKYVRSVCVPDSPTSVRLSLLPGARETHGSASRPCQYAHSPEVVSQRGQLAPWTPSVHSPPLSRPSAHGNQNSWAEGTGWDPRRPLPSQRILSLPPRSIPCSLPLYYAWVPFILILF